MNEKEVDAAISSVRGNFAIEDMPMDEVTEKDCRDILSGKKTIDEVMKEIISNYSGE